MIEDFCEIVTFFKHNSNIDKIIENINKKLKNSLSKNRPKYERLLEQKKESKKEMSIKLMLIDKYYLKLSNMLKVIKDIEKHMESNEYKDNNNNKE